MTQFVQNCQVAKVLLSLLTLVQKILSLSKERKKIQREENARLHCVLSRLINLDVCFFVLLPFRVN